MNCNKIIKRVLVLTVLLAVFSNQAVCQYDEFSDIDTREVMVSFRDSTIKACVSLDDPNFEPDMYKVYYWYNSNKIHKNLGGFHGDLLHGKYLVLNQEKDMIVQGTFSKGLKTGEWKRWYGKGGLQLIEHWKNGVLDGEKIVYSPEGKLSSKENFSGGQKEGEAYYYIGDSLITKKYVAGVEVPTKEALKQKQLEEKKENARLKQEAAKQKEAEREELRLKKEEAKKQAEAEKTSKELENPKPEKEPKKEKSEKPDKTDKPVKEEKKKKEKNDG